MNNLDIQSSLNPVQDDSVQDDSVQDVANEDGQVTTVPGNSRKTPFISTLRMT